MQGAGGGRRWLLLGKPSAGFRLRLVNAVIAVALENMGCVNSHLGPRIPCFWSHGGVMNGWEEFCFP